MKRKLPFLLLCLLFLGIFLYSGIQLLSILREYRAGEKSYEALTAYVQVPETTQPASTEAPKDPVPGQTEPKPQTKTTPNEPAWPMVDFASLQKINPDVVAWIYMEGTVINYPVVRGEDNSLYLDRMVDGSYNGAGSIFMDYRNSADYSDRHTILYGHHMNNNTMFGLVADYVAKDLSEEHPYCMILTPDRNYKLEFFSGYIIDPNADSWQLDFYSDEEYSQWLDRAMERSYISTDVVPTAEDRVVTLSTCTYEYDDARCVLLGVLRPAQTELEEIPAE